MNKKRVLIIGAGNRVQNTILPALFILSNRFEITGVLNRGPKSISYAKTLKPFKTQNIKQFHDFKDVDIVIVAVTPDQVPSVLSKIPFEEKKKMTLVIETPVVAISQIGNLKVFEHFKKVVIAEEHLYLPPIKLAQKLMSSGIIGKVQRVTLSHFGYLHHAYAMIKFLTNYPGAYLIWQSPWDANGTIKKLVLPGGVKASLIEPQDYGKGGFSISGDQGEISDQNKNVSHKLTYLKDKNTFRGLILNGMKVATNPVDKLYLKKIDQCLFDRNFIKSMKIRAYMDVLLNMKTQSYDAVVSYSDSLIMGIVEHIGFAFDLPNKKSTRLSDMIRFIAKI